MLRLGLNSAGRSLVGWVGGFGLCLLAGRSAPFALPIPKLRSCCSAETAYEQQLGNLGMGRAKGADLEQERLKVWDARGRFEEALTRLRAPHEKLDGGLA